MREIKFRIWGKHEILDREPNTIYWYSRNPREFEMRMNEPFNLREMMDDERCKIEKDDIIMQFTGLHDKNGKEIYEGDIIKYKQNTKGGYAKKTYYIESIKDEPPHLDCSKDIEVIGNIYEHPELIK